MKAVLFVLVLLAGLPGAPSTYGRVRYVGDSLTWATPGYIEAAGGGNGVAVYYLANAVLYLEEAGHWTETVIQLGSEAVSGADKLYNRNSELFDRRYRQVVDAAREHSSEVVIVNIPWLNWRADEAAKAQEFNDIIHGIAGEYGICVADAWAVMEACGADCIGEDDRPNEAGYALIGREVWRCRAGTRIYLPVAAQQ